MKIDTEKLNNIARDFNEVERARMSDRRTNRYWRCASSAIVNKISRRLRVLNLSTAEFASKLNMDACELEGMLDGKTNFDLKTMIAIERAIGVHIIDQDVIPQTTTSPMVSVKVEYKVSIPGEKNNSSIEKDGKEEFTTLSNSIGKSKMYLIYG